MNQELEEYRLEVANLKNQQATIRRKSFYKNSCGQLNRRHRICKGFMSMDREQLRSELQSVHSQDTQLQERLDEEANSSLEVSLTAKRRLSLSYITNCTSWKLPWKVNVKSATAEQKIKDLKAQVVEQKALIVKLEEEISKGFGPSHDRRHTKQLDDSD
uniref:Uncharacterized protein n=1 Tax=Physcomitrium patens TaxID=3218 RepID=A0A2K1J9T4_PHYPA|nr:hypothetical protein PHYPA_021397 [Physcomitrium patens]